MYPESYVAVSSLETIQAFEAELPVSGLLKQAVHTLSLPSMSFEDSILLQVKSDWNFAVTSILPSTFEPGNPSGKYRQSVGRIQTRNSGSGKMWLRNRGWKIWGCRGCWSTTRHCPT